LHWLTLVVFLADLDVLFLTMSDWETCKENIQPLRGGRRAAALAVAASPASNLAGGSSVSTPTFPLGASADKVKEIRDQRAQFEAKLREASAGEDPLSAWFDYVKWCEQTFPRGGKESGLRVLLEKCIKEFKEDQRYTQDQRYLDIWVKYAALSQSPLDIYSFMYSHKLCTDLADLYVNWAWELERVGNLKKAEHVFNKAGERVVGEEAISALAKARDRFQARAIKQLSQSGVAEPQAAPEERGALASLRGQRVGSVRVGAAKRSDQPGRLEGQSSAPSTNAGRPSFAIFADENQKSTLLLPSVATGDLASAPLPFGGQRNKENDRKAGKWTGALPSSGRAFKHAEPSHASFAVHEDPNVAPPANKTALKMDAKALSVKKAADDNDVPLAIFEPPDPTKRPMYCKHLVYQGATEFSFEELRAIKFRKRQEERKIEAKRLEMKRMTEEIEAKQDAIRRDQETLARQRDEFQRMQEQMMREQEEKMKEMQRMAMEKQQEEFRRMQAEFAKITQQQQQQKLHLQQHQRGRSFNNSSADASDRKSSLLEDTATLLRADPMVRNSSNVKTFLRQLLSDA